MREQGESARRTARRLATAGIPHKAEEPLSRHTTIGLGGPAELFVEPRFVEEIATVLEIAAAEGMPFRVLGAGSNLLVDDGGVRGVVLHTGALDFVRFLEAGRVEAGAGVHFPTLVRKTAASGLRGIEAGVGIPGSLGGVLTMNAGAYDFSIGRHVERVSAVSPHRGPIVLARDQIDFRYRASSFGSDLIVASALLALTKDEPAAIKFDLDRHMRFRKETQPVGVKSAGCIFKNPEGDSAGRLIDSVGLKGFRVGGARISDVHANFIVHDGKASAADVLGLIDAVREKVFRDSRIALEAEVMTWS
ncbi:MAG TPA: UDP-N-acetylmuramate dehydrogenase [Vicinamibacteria bacterium]|nr:UDP-N-acetylmuramate dehydrogenase [Vicinamibacteria bacterium]